MRLSICLATAIALMGAPVKKKTEAQAPASQAADNKCIDTPRVLARKRPPVKKLELSENMQKELHGVLFGVSVNDKLELNIDMQSPSEDSATQLEKMVGVLASAEQLKSAPGEAVVIDLQKSSHVTRNGKLVRTTLSLTDQQLEKLLEARYGRKLIAEAKARMVYVHGLYGGTKSYPWGDGIVIDLGR